MMQKSPFVELPQFEGPLELLLFLIKKEEINIADIPISLITERYLAALRRYREINLDFGGEFLVMASTLMFIKSKMLLPLDPTEEEGEEGRDPRADLVRQLLEFQMFQEAAENFRACDILGQDAFEAQTPPEDERLLSQAQDDQPLAPIGLYELIKHYKRALDRSRENIHHVTAEEVPLRKCIELLVERLQEKESVSFTELVADRWSLRELVVNFLAILELGKMNYIRFYQTETYGHIRIHRNPEVIDLDLQRLSWI